MAPKLWHRNYGPSTKMVLGLCDAIFLQLVASIGTNLKDPTPLMEEPSSYQLLLFPKGDHLMPANAKE